MASVLALTACRPASGSVNAGMVQTTPIPDVVTVVCYHVQLGTWTESRQGKGLIPPANFLLDTAPARHPFAPKGAHTTLPRIRGRDWTGYWIRPHPDTLMVSWSNGFSSGGYRFVVRGDSVKGLATTFSDARVSGELDPVAPASGHRTACPSSSHVWQAI